MNPSLKIYIDRLKDGRKELIQEQFSPEEIALNDQEIPFSGPVSLKAEVYLVDDELVLHLDLSATSTHSCSVCNQEVKHSIIIKNCYQTVEKSQIKGAIYDMSGLLRELLLLEVPSFVECEDNCPRRKDMEKFLKRVDEKSASHENPFSHLTIKE